MGEHFEKELLVLAASHQIFEILLKEPKRLRMRKSGLFLDGRKVSDKVVSDALFMLEHRLGRRLVGISKKFLNGNILLEEWENNFKNNLQAGQLYSSSLASGSIVKSKELWSYKNAVAYQQTYLNYFKQDISIDEPSDAKILWRTDLYKHSVFTTFSDVELEIKKMQGYSEAKRYRRALESCDGCRTVARKGWIDINEMPPIGKQNCRMKCKCVTKFR